MRGQAKAVNSASCNGVGNASREQDERFVGPPIAGVVAGGAATWFRQRHWRRAARQHEADARQVRAQLADLRSAAAPSRYDPQRLPAPPQGVGYGAGGRDKPGATL